MITTDFSRAMRFAPRNARISWPTVAKASFPPMTPAAARPPTRRACVADADQLGQRERGTGSNPGAIRHSRASGLRSGAAGGVRLDLSYEYGLRLDSGNRPVLVVGVRPGTECPRRR